MSDFTIEDFTKDELKILRQGVQLALAVHKYSYYPPIRQKYSHLDKKLMGIERQFYRKKHRRFLL